jgi:hypothetical protein
MMDGNFNVVLFVKNHASKQSVCLQDIDAISNLILT